jgi:SAM-dependent methyltransferase
MNVEALDSKTKTVGAVYADAAARPAGLCCPQSYKPEFTQHIPKQAFDHNYGCGSPLLKAGVQAGETVVDLGSGVGIDCFVAARLVGPKGKVIGVDMTDAMLSQAALFNCMVAAELGFDVVEFRKGVIEKLPIDDNSVDLVISNCVLNLSLSQETVMKEIHRILRPGGRMVISDIVVDREIAEADRNNEQLWAECYTGAIPVGKLVSTYKGLGFLGLTQLDESTWEKVAGYNFGSITLRAYKLPSSKVSGCVYGGHAAIYLGPYASVKDEEDHDFVRFSPTEVCDATAARLRMQPYSDAFLVLDIPALAKASPLSACGCAPGVVCAPAEQSVPAKASCCDSASACC